MPDEIPVRLGVGEAAAISVVSYLLYVASSLILFEMLPLKAGAAISSVVLFTSAYYLVWRADGRPADYVGLRRLSSRLTLYSVLASLALIPVAASVMAVVMSYLDIPKAWLDAAYELVRADDLRGLFFAWVVAALLAAIGEEFIFRGVLQNSLASRYASWVAVLIASIVFGVLHVWRFPAAFILGAFLGSLYAVTGTLVAPIVAHVTINSVVVIGSFLLDRAEPGSLPDWIAEDAPAPVLLLVLSGAVFALFMALILRASRSRHPTDPEKDHVSGPNGTE